MRLLVTRPADQAEQTAQKLRTLGHLPIVAPVLEIAPTGAPLPQGGFDLVLATSAQALARVALTAELLGLPLACVGEKTAGAARTAGFSVLYAAPDAEALADFLRMGGVAKSALYLAGHERRASLEDTLRAAGWRIEIVETYAAQAVQAWPADLRAALDAGEIDGVLHYSPRSAALALALIGREPARRLRHFCISSAVAAVCRDWAPESAVFAAFHPDEEALITLLGAEGPPCADLSRPRR
jgi:uroporphyrinogen-III synthase